MNEESPKMISLAEWDERYALLKAKGLQEPWYGGPLRRHVEDGDARLLKLRYDNSPAALRLWNFLLTEEDRLHQARAAGKKIVGTMKDLGTVPVMADAFENVVAFYPDGAWWLPCVLEIDSGLLAMADSLGVGESFCPVRAMLGAFVTRDHFPIPDLLVCSVGATCDDFSAIAQRLNGLGYPIFWWEIPHRRSASTGEEAITLPGGFQSSANQISFVKSELERVKKAMEDVAGIKLDETRLREGIQKANAIRQVLDELRALAYASDVCPMPALEMQIAEMLAIHFCSDREECLAVLSELLTEVKRRVKMGLGVLSAQAARIFWVNPVADLRVMNLLEACGGRVCGTEYLFCHAMDKIPEDLPPMEALARMAMADPMTGSSLDRASRIYADIKRFGAEAVIISRIPGASHCAWEGKLIGKMIDLPVLEIEVPPVSDSLSSAIRTRMEALVETVLERRKDGQP